MGDQDPRLVGLIGDPKIAGMDTNGGFTQQDVNAEGLRQKGRLPTTLTELRQGLDNRARQASMVHPQDRQGMAGTVAAHAQPTRQPTPDELLAQANAMMESQHNQHAASLAAGPSQSPRDASGRQLPSWLTQEMSKDEQL